MKRKIPIDPALEKGYNVRLLVDDFDALIEKWSKWSEDFRANELHWQSFRGSASASSMNSRYGQISWSDMMLSVSHVLFCTALFHFTPRISCTGSH